MCLTTEICPEQFEKRIEEERSLGTQILSVNFPELQQEDFLRLAGTKNFAEKFFIENRSRGLALLGLGICKQIKLGQSLRQSSLGVPVEALYFCAVPFDSTRQKELPAYLARWQFRLCGNKLYATRNIDLEKESCSLAQLKAEYNSLIESSTDCETKPFSVSFSAAQEVGGNWYLKACEEMLEKISAGNLNKIVLARAIDYEAKTAIPRHPLLVKLREHFLDKNCTLFLFSLSPENCFLGASPEMLLHAKNKILETEAIAGTIPNHGKTLAELKNEILDDKKERWEHQTVVNFIVEKLRALNLTPQFPDTPELLVLPNVIHLKTPIRAETETQIPISSLIQSLHPTPAMCGTPAKEAFQTIIETEAFPRENYAAPFGFYNANGEGFFVVGIRSGKITGKKLRIYAGAGLVSGSIPQKEFEEINAKFSAFKTLLA